MKIKVSKVFAKFVNETAKEAGKQFTAKVIGMSANEYACHCGLWSDPYADYNARTGKFDVLAVYYPGEFYACPRYVGTEELTNEVRRARVDNFEDLARLIVDMFEI